MPFTVSASANNRRARLAGLLATKFKGNRNKLIAASGLSKGRVAQLFDPEETFGETAGINLARKLGLPEGYFELIAHATDAIPSATPREAEGGEEDLVIPQYDTGGKMGSGLVLRDQPGVIHSWHVTPEWIAKNVRNATSASNLCIVTGFGDSMRPMYNPGDPLLVDRGVTSLDFDGVYFFRVGDEGFIKRLQRVPGEGIVAISENKAYRDWTIKADMDFAVLARVIKVWKGEEF